MTAPRPIVWTWADGAREMFEAIITVASLRGTSNDQPIHVAFKDTTPTRPDLKEDVRSLLRDLGAETPSFEGVGHRRTDLQTHVLSALDGMGDASFYALVPGAVFHEEPRAPKSYGASVSIRNPWPECHLYGDPRGVIWQNLADDLGFDVSQIGQPHLHPASLHRWPGFDGRIIWGPMGRQFSQVFDRISDRMHRAPPEKYQTLDLEDHVVEAALPFVFEDLSASQVQPSQRADITPAFPLVFLYCSAPDPAIDALESAVSANRIKRVLKGYEPARKLIYQGKGRLLRERFYGPPPQNMRRLVQRIERNTPWWAS
ncbi:MAG: hypothetical protein AAGJ34_08085 [Pseudomonadota bacterium]